MRVRAAVMLCGYFMGIRRAMCIYARQTFTFVVLDAFIAGIGFVVGSHTVGCVQLCFAVLPCEHFVICQAQDHVLRASFL